MVRRTPCATIFAHEGGHNALPLALHYTANTGHVAETSHSAVDQYAIDVLLPIVDAQEGDFPELGIGIDIMTPIDEQRQRLPGAAFFQIGPAGDRMSKTPYVIAVCCWRADREGTVSFQS
jgi:hypothetical protein